MQIFKIFSGEHARGPLYSRFWHLSCLKLHLSKIPALEKVTKIGALSLKKF